jgi:hypothetical protein
MDAPSPVEYLGYLLRFGFLFDAGRAFAFPCDASGEVDLSSLSEIGRRNYRRAWDSVGREVSCPQIQLNSPSRRR